MKGDDSHTIVVSGNIELTEVSIAFEIPGRLTQLTVDEGDPVKKDMILACIDQQQLLHQRDRARAALAATESQLAQLRTAIQYQRETLQGRLALVPVF